MENNTKSTARIDVATVVQAFEALGAHTSSQQVIRNADQYILQCEQVPQFSLVLLSIFTQLPDGQTKRQVLIHFKNVIKRNWTNRRKTVESCLIPQQVKEQIKSSLLTIFKQTVTLSNPYSKEFTQIFKYLARQEFPVNYPALHSFIQEVLTGIAAYTIQQVLNSTQLLSYLSIVKVVYKQYGERRMTHTEAMFAKYSASIIETAITILSKINQAMSIIKTNSHNLDMKTGRQLLECSRKIDKIVLYCLHSMVSSMQYNPTIREVLKFQLEKIQTLLQLPIPQLRQQIMLNVLAIVELSSKLQSHFPLLFSKLLGPYIRMLLTLTFSSSSSTFGNYDANEHEKYNNALIVALTRIISCFANYMEAELFEQSLECKKSNNLAADKQAQAECHAAWSEIFTNETICSMLEKIISQKMVSCSRVTEEDEIVFEEGQVSLDPTSESGTFELLVGLVRAIMDRFPKQSNIFVEKVISHLLAMGSEQPLSKVTRNMYEIVLLVPKVHEQVDISMPSVFSLMEKCFGSRNYDMFCRLIRNYHEQFAGDTVLQSFKILTSIMSNTDAHPSTVYQSAACIRKFLLDYEELNLPLESLAPCLTRIFSLISVYRTNPTHLWNLLNLLLQLLRAVSGETVLSNLAFINQCIQELVQNQDNDHVVQCALADLLQSLLALVEGWADTLQYLQERQGLCVIAVKLIGTQAKQDEDQNVDLAKNCLWLFVCRNVHAKTCSSELSSALVQLFAAKKEQLMASDPALLFELLQQYSLANLTQLSASDLVELHQQLLSNIESQPGQTRLLLSFTSLCITHLLVSQQWSPQLLQISMGRVMELFGKVSPSINALRMMTLLHISINALVFGWSSIIPVLNQTFADKWIEALLGSLQFVNNKYGAKVITLAVLQTLAPLQDVLIVPMGQNLPIDMVLKFTVSSLEPLKQEQAMNTYLSSSVRVFSHAEQIKSRNKIHISNIHNNSSNKQQYCPYSRRVRLHVHSAWVQADLKTLFKEQIGALLSKWDWGIDDLQERYTESIVQKIVGLLANKPTN